MQPKGQAKVMLQILLGGIIYIAGLALLGFLSYYLKLRSGRTILLYNWHTIFSFVYYIISLDQSSDAKGYYEFAPTSFTGISFGTDFVMFMVGVLSNHINLSFFNTFLIFNLIGTIGLLAFDASLQEVVTNKGKWLKRLATLVVFLPSVSFWSAAIGKDAISFMATGLALWAALQPSNRYGLMVFSIVSMLVVRPHIAGIMLVALSLSFVFQKKMHLGKRLGLLLVSCIAVSAAIPFALNYAGLNILNSADDIEAYVQQRQDYNQDGGGGVDISSMSLPMQLATYVFRPLPFEAHSITSFAASLDNLILMLVFYIGIKNWRIARKRQHISTTYNTSFLWIYSLLTWLVLAVTTANLGIAVRQKWMFVPILVFLLLNMAPTKKRKSAPQVRSHSHQAATPLSI